VITSPPESKKGTTDGTSSGKPIDQLYEAPPVQILAKIKWTADNGDQILSLQQIIAEGQQPEATSIRIGILSPKAQEKTRSLKKK